ncbi:MAG: HAMP domain-containing sensor histidine kinase [archaeon]
MKANEELIRLNEVKDNFLSSVSHELKTPLTSIKTYNQIIYNQILGPINNKQKEAINTILSSINCLEALIKNILDVSKYEAGKAEFNIELFDLNKIIPIVEKEFEPQLSTIQATLIINIAKKGVIIYADKQKITQVFRNLINNAIKYRSEKKLKIEINIKRTKKEVIISIRDNGIGISKENQKNLFSKFYQIDSGPARKTEGTGLGLFIIKHIVEGHSGNLNVISKLGKGTSFIIHLPVKKA